MLLDDEIYEFLIQYIYREYDLPIQEYCQLIAKPLSATKKSLIELWLTRLYSGILQESTPSLKEDLTLVEKLVLQRWSIDVGQYDFSIKIFEDLNRQINDLPSSIVNWIVFLAAKAKQHKGEHKEALYFYDQLRNENLEPILSLYLHIERAYVFYYLGNFQNSFAAMETFGKFLNKKGSKKVQAKILCNYGVLLFCYGKIGEAKLIFRKLVGDSKTSIFYRNKALLFLFQIYIEIRDFKEAGKIFFEVKQIFYDLTNEHRFDFCRYWIMYLLQGSDVKSAEALIHEVERDLLQKAFWAHKINFWADCFMLSISQIILYSRGCKKQSDRYSRYYLWLKQIAKNAKVISDRRKIKILQIMIPYFQSQMLYFDLFLAQTLLYRLQNAEIDFEWVQKIHNFGQSYLLNILTEASKDIIVIAFCQESQLLFTSEDKCVDLGRDKHSRIILSYLSRGDVSSEFLIEEIFGDKNIDFHSFNKLRVSIYRINKKIGAEVIEIFKERVSIRSKYVLFEVK